MRGPVGLCGVSVQDEMALTAAYPDDYVGRPTHAKRRLSAPERHVTYPSAPGGGRDHVDPADHDPAADYVTKRRSRDQLGDDVTVADTDVTAHARDETGRS